MHFYIHIISQQLDCRLKPHNAVTSHCGEKDTRCSETIISLQRQTSSLQRQASTTRASQPEPTYCSKNHTRYDECSLSQLNKVWNPKLNLLFTIWASSLQRKLYSLQRVFPVSNNQTCILEHALLFTICTYSLLRDPFLLQWVYLIITIPLIQTYSLRRDDFIVFSLCYIIWIITF